MAERAAMPGFAAPRPPPLVVRQSALSAVDTQTEELILAQTVLERAPSPTLVWDTLVRAMEAGMLWAVKTMGAAARNSGGSASKA